jgi:hypothetical protein
VFARGCRARVPPFIVREPCRLLDLLLAISSGDQRLGLASTRCSCGYVSAARMLSRTSPSRVSALVAACDLRVVASARALWQLGSPPRQRSAPVIGARATSCAPPALQLFGREVHGDTGWARRRRSASDPASTLTCSPPTTLLIFSLSLCERFELPCRRPTLMHPSSASACVPLLHFRVKMR